MVKGDLDLKRKQRNLLLGLLGVLVCLAVILCAFITFRKCKKASMKHYTYSTACSTTAALVTELRKNNPDLEKIFSTPDEQWRTVTTDEYDKIIKELDDNSHSLDAGPSRPLLDLWGNRLVIVYRKSSKGYYDLLVISKGADGIYGNKDDVVSSYGESSPPLEIKYQE